MVTNKTYEYGIKYRVLKVAQSKFLLIPFSLEGGLSDGIDFSTDVGVIPICNCEKDLKSKYVIDNVYTTDELEEMYDYHDDTDFLSSYFYEDVKDTLMYVEVDKASDSLKKYNINLRDFAEREYDMTYFLEKDVPSILLNEDAFNEILQADDAHSMKVILQRYKKLVKSFEEYNRKNGVTKIEVSDGKVVSVETNKQITNASNKKNVDVEKNPEAVPFGGVDVSYNGLRKAIKERVFGHDEEIDTIAQKLYLNYTALPEDGTESILIVGPTGTGKTETVRAAKDYLCVPYFEINAANLVPQGIRGTSIEDVIISLYEESGRDLPRAQRGMVFLDEFDKVPDSDLEIKTVMKDILLSFNDGSKILIDNDNYHFIFDSKMASKLYGGVFERISNVKSSIGFGARENSSLGNEREIREKIIRNGYYSEEDISRINTVIGYNQLTRETKKEILLLSKLSALAKKKNRYKRQFGIDLSVSEDFVDSILDQISNDSNGMRSLNNFVKKTVDFAEKAILENEKKKYKRLVLTRDTVLDPHKFDIS